MVLVLVTTKSDSKLTDIAGKVSPLLNERGYDQICFVKTDTTPVVVSEGKMTVRDETMLFVFGMNMDHQGDMIRFEMKLTEATGFNTEIF